MIESAETRFLTLMGVNQICFGKIFPDQIYWQKLTRQKNFDKKILDKYHKDKNYSDRYYLDLKIRKVYKMLTLM